MAIDVLIGTSSVRVERPELLPPQLQGLTRSPTEETPNAQLSVVRCAASYWDVDLALEGDTHCFGRITYRLEVIPHTRHIRLIFAADPDADALYWLRRDIFGVLSCFSGQLMLHASAVINPAGGAWVFCGPSGVGKSTLCRALETIGLQPINDEINWLYEEGDKLHVVNQPHWFEKHPGASLPAQGLWLLEQADKCKFTDAGLRSVALAKLLAAHLSIDAGHEFMRQRAEALKRLVQRDTLERLQFNLNLAELKELLWTRLPS